MVLAIGFIGVVIAVAAAWQIAGGAGKQADVGQYYTAAIMPLEVSINKDGELQAIRNVDIVNPIEGSSTIQFIVKEGTSVKKGETLVIIDSTEIAQKLETATLDLQKAQSDVIAAKEGKEIQESTNIANLEGANVELILARLDLQQYEEGTFPQLLDEARRNLEMSKISVRQKEQDLAQLQALFSKGFVNAAEVKTAEINLLKEQNDLQKKQTDLTVLEKYTHEKDVTDKRNKVAQAEKKLVRVQRENASQLAQKVADLQAKQQSLVLRQRQYDNLKKQLDSTTITAPSDGLVVYGSSSGSPWGRRDQPIQAGASVRYQETLIRLPDTSAMKAVARIQEAQVTRLRVDPKNPMRAAVKIVGVPEPVRGSVSNISVMSDSSQRYWGNPDSKEYPVDITLDTTPPGLKPGVGAVVEIFVERINSTLAVPLASIYSAGRDSYVFLRGDPPRPTKVTLGSVNNTHAQIVEGLKPGQDVLILGAGQGRELLDRAGIKSEPTTRPVVDEFGPPPEAQQAPGARGAGGGGDRSRTDEAGAVAPTTAPAGAGGEGRRRSSRGSGSGGGSPRPSATTD
jgi:multidrug efflux pump subunit AcrA (membrane-fusion protein)